MDGYAVIAGDLVGASNEHPAQLTVVDDVPAGFRATEVVTRGVAIRIMTGAPMPDGADAVVPVEKTDGGTDFVQINEPVSFGANVRLAGEDIDLDRLLRITRLAVVLGQGQRNLLGRRLQGQARHGRQARHGCHGCHGCHGDPCSCFHNLVFPRLVDGWMLFIC